MWILDIILPYIVSYIRPFIKWFLHTFTRLCELQRLCYGAKSGASRARQVEKSLMQSKIPEIMVLRKELDDCAERDLRMELEQDLTPRAVMIVQRVKKIKARSHPDFGPLFAECVLQIWSYRRMVNQVEKLRATEYDSDKLDHEYKLLELWANMMPDEPLKERITKQWQEIGFQGDDPKTDFRGMGLLGLDQLVFFSREHKTAAQHVLSRSKHPRGYTFAIVGINLTFLAVRLLKDGEAKTHFYNLAQAKKSPCTLEDFHRFYCYLFFEFDKFWFDCDTVNIMDFRNVYSSFEITIRELLHHDDTMFKMNLIVDQI